jgi:hypothetical protein
MTTTSGAETHIEAARNKGGRALIAAALGFVLLYLIVDFVVPSLASSALPLPNDPASDVRTWYAENQLAAVAQGACQFLSVAALALFVVRLRTFTAFTRQEATPRATPWGLAAVGLMMLSSVFGWLLAALAPDASLDTVSVLRTANFVAGGTAHVLALGVFVLLSSRIPVMSRPMRILGIVAVTPAALSLLSLVWFQGAVFILLGRLLCMIWTISAAISLTRRM